MADFVVLQRLESGIPGMEIMIAEVSDAETFTSDRFKFITGAVASYNMASGFANENAGITLSNQIATVQMLGTDTSDVRLCICFFGRE